MLVQTGRFGQIEVSEREMIRVPSGILGFPNEHDYCLVDPGDDTLVLWLQSLKTPSLAFPVIEPKIFRPTYIVKLSAAELRELQLTSLKNASVYSILTIPSDITQMTANLKAPLVINTSSRVAKQVVLQENDLPIKHPMFKELRAHLLSTPSIHSYPSATALHVDSLPMSPAVAPLT